MLSRGRGIGLSLSKRIASREAEAFPPVSAVTATRTSASSATISFSPPANDTPTGYRLFESKDGSAFTEVLPYSLEQTGLEPGVYVWQIVSVYAAGESRPIGSNAIEAFINRSLDFTNKFHSTMIHGI